MPLLHQLLVFHHCDSKFYIENKVHKRDKLKAQKQIHLHIDCSQMMKQSEWKGGKMGLKFYFLPRKIKWILLHKIQKYQLLLDANVKNKIVQFLE